MIRSLLLILLIGWMASCQNPRQRRLRESVVAVPDSAVAASYLKDGDLLLRSDDDIVGLSLRNMNDSDKAFSHSGIAFFEDDRWYVYHMMAGEENPTLEMRRDPLVFFIDRERKSGYGIYRYRLTATETDSLHQLLAAQYAQKLAFDTAFNLADDETMYCSELISKDLSQVTGGRVVIPTTFKENFSFKARYGGKQPPRDVEYIAIDNLYLNEWCRLVFRKEYQQGD